MQLTCNIDQAEAIRRGHSANSTVKLDFDPADLTQEERNTLALHFNDGRLINTGSAVLPEPTLQGLKEGLAAIASATAAWEQEQREREQRKFDSDMEIIRARQTHPAAGHVHAYRGDNGIIVLTENSYLGEAGYRETEPYTYLRTTDFSEKAKATPEYQSWRADLEAFNAAAKREAERRVIEKCLHTCEESDIEAERVKSVSEYFAGVIRNQGTPMQITRLDRGLIDVSKEASAILTKALIANPRNLKPATIPDGFEYSAESKSSLTDEEMALVLEYETATPPSSGRIEKVTIYPTDDSEEFSRCELEITMPHVLGIILRRRFVVA